MVEIKDVGTVDIPEEKKKKHNNYNTEDIGYMYIMQ